MDLSARPASAPLPPTRIRSAATGSGGCGGGGGGKLRLQTATADSAGPAGLCRRGAQSPGQPAKFCVRHCAETASVYKSRCMEGGKGGGGECDGVTGQDCGSSAGYTRNLLVLSLVIFCIVLARVLVLALAWYWY